MKKHPGLVLCLLLVFLPCLSLWGKDFGLILDQNPSYGGSGTDAGFEYSGLLIPRYSTLLGDDAEFIVSMGLRLDYMAENLTFVPELLRTEFTFRADNVEVKTGRIPYSDPLGFIAEGLFDGTRVSVDMARGIFSVGAWYTGLLYNRRVNITMTPQEMSINSAEIDYDDFLNTYFAPRRIFSALDWEYLSLTERLRARFSLLGQFDLSGANMHTQYLIGKLSIPYRDFVFSLGGSLGLIQNSGEFGIGLAGELGAAWALPTALEDQLSFLGRFSSGVIKGGVIYAFEPITTKAHGDILKARFSGFSMLSLDYLVRLHQNMSLGFTSSYFVLSDLATYSGLGTDGHFLGNEFFGRLVWSPISDIQLNLGAGVFLPSLGNAAPNANMLWRVELNIIFSLY